MKKRSIIKKIQAAILAMAVSISLLAACTDSTEKPADNKTAEDLGIKALDAPASDVADEPSKTESLDDLSEEEDDETPSIEDISDSMKRRNMKWDTGSEVTVTQGNCDFHAFLSTDGKESWIYKVTSHKDRPKKLSFPAKVKDAPVTKIGMGYGFYSDGEDGEDDCYYTIFESTVEPWHGVLCYTGITAASITTIEFPETLTQIEAAAFCGFKKLKKVKIPDGVKELTPYSFAGCRKLTEVKFPAELTTVDVKAFDKSKAISKLTIPSKNKNFKTKNGFLLSKDSKRLIWAASAMTEVIIPEGVTKIEDNALFATKARKVVVSKSVRDIGYCALSGHGIEKIEVEKGNKVFKADGNCLYNKSDKSLVAVVIKNGKAEISSKVKILGEGISVTGYRIKRVDIPKSVNKVVGDWMFFNDWLFFNETTGTKVYFHGTKPPQTVSKAFIPISHAVYVPKKAKMAYIQWAIQVAKDKEGLRRNWLVWDDLHTF